MNLAKPLDVLPKSFIRFLSDLMEIVFLSGAIVSPLKVCDQKVTELLLSVY